MNTETLIHALIQKHMIKFGDFTLKSGKHSPIYINLREMIAYPELMTEIADMIFANKPQDLHPELICGVPYSALTLATYLAIKHHLPMILKRKEAKTYGTKQILEGVFQPGMNCLVIEDVLTTGQSTLETVNELRAAGLQVTEVLAFIDREQGAKANFAEASLNYHTVFTLTTLLQQLERNGILDHKQVETILQQHEAT